MIEKSYENFYFINNQKIKNKMSNMQLALVETINDEIHKFYSLNSNYNNLSLFNKFINLCEFHYNTTNQKFINLKDLFASIDKLGNSLEKQLIK